MRIISKNIEEKIKEKHGFKDDVVSLIIKEYINEISEHIHNNDTVTIIGLGSFRPKIRKSRFQHCVNRKEVIEVPESTLPSFYFTQHFLSSYKNKNS